MCQHRLRNYVKICPRVSAPTKTSDGVSVIMITTNLLGLLNEKQILSDIHLSKEEPEGNTSQSNQCEWECFELRDNPQRTFEAGNEN